MVTRNPSRFSTRLLDWYRQHGRILPWRGHPDPYAVWVSEIMLQQTRIEAVIPYFEKWMQLFPTVRDLAAASEQDVLNTWEGLGYYSRARNLHKAAKIVADQYGGKLPQDLKALRGLPGIGRYTVGAIASIAFGMDEPTLDGNLRRVFARLFDVSEYADSPAGEKLLWELAAKHLPKGRRLQPGTHGFGRNDLPAEKPTLSALSLDGILPGTWQRNARTTSGVKTEERNTALYPRGGYYYPEWKSVVSKTPIERIIGWDVGIPQWTS